MSDKSVPEQQYRTLRWWALLLAVGVLVCNLVFDYQLRPLTAVTTWYKALFQLDQPTLNDGISKLPSVSTELSQFDSNWKEAMRIPASADAVDALLKQNTGNPEFQRMLRAQFCNLYYMDNGIINTDKLKDAIKQEPQNAIYPMLIANGYFEKAGLDISHSKIKNWTNITVDHPDQLALPLKFAQQALQSPYLKSYRAEYIHHQMSRIAAPTLTVYQVAYYEALNRIPIPLVSQRFDFCQYYGAAMVYLAHHGQLKQAQLLSKSWQSGFLRQMPAEFYDSWEAMSYSGNITTLVSATAEVARLAGDSETASRCNAYVKHIRQSMMQTTPSNYDLLYRHGSLFSALIYPIPLSQDLTVNNLEPLRTAEQCVMEQIMANNLRNIAGGVLIVLLLVMAFSNTLEWSFAKKDTLAGIGLSLLPWIIYGLLLLLAPHMLMRQYGYYDHKLLFLAQRLLPLILSLLLPSWWMWHRLRRCPQRPGMVMWLAAFLLITVVGNYCHDSVFLFIVICIVAFLLVGASKLNQILAQWAQGLSICMAILWLFMALVVYPLLTASESAAWKRDMIIDYGNTTVNRTERKLTAQYASQLNNALEKYGILKDAEVK